jgi:hypothetical protein
MKRFCFFIALILVGIGARASLADSADVYSNPTIGFEITKPSDWHFASLAEYRQNQDNVELEDEKFTELMRKYSTAPLVALFKFPEPYDDVNPSFKVTIKPYGQQKGKAPDEILNIMLPPFRLLFQDFQIVRGPEEVSVSGVPSAHARVTYMLKAGDGNTYPTASEIWIVPYGDYYFLMGAGMNQDGKTGAPAEIAAIVESIRIGR